MILHFLTICRQRVMEPLFILLQQDNKTCRQLFYCVKFIFVYFAATLPPTCLKRPVYGHNRVVADGWQCGSKIKNTPKIEKLCTHFLGFPLIILYLCRLKFNH